MVKKSISFNIIFFLVSCFFDLAAFAQSPLLTAIVPEFRVNEYKGPHVKIRDNASIAVDGSGDFVIAWNERHNDDGDFFAQRFTADGSVLGNNFRITNVIEVTQEDYNYRAIGFVLDDNLPVYSAPLFRNGVIIDSLERFSQVVIFGKKAEMGEISVDRSGWLPLRTSEGKSGWVRYRDIVILSGEDVDEFLTKTLEYDRDKICLN